MSRTTRNAVASSSRSQMNGSQNANGSQRNGATQHSQSQSQFQSQSQSQQDDERLVKPDIDGEDDVNGGGGGDEEDDDANDDPRMRWTRDTFTDVPMSKVQMLEVLRTIKHRYGDVRESLRKGMQLAMETARSVEEASPDDDMIEDIEKNVWTLLEHRQILAIRREVVDEVINELRNGEEITNLDEHLRNLTDARVAEYTSKSLRVKFKDDEEYRKFRTEIWEVAHEDEACPPVSRWLPRGDNDAEEDEDEIEMGGTVVTFRCPITMRMYEDACVSIVCNHHYSYAAIMQHIEQSARQRTPARCPVAGCSKVLTAKVIKRDPDMQRRADKRAQRDKERDEAAAADDVDVL